MPQGFTAVKAVRASRRWLTVPFAILMVCALLLGVVVIIVGTVLAAR